MALNDELTNNTQYNHGSISGANYGVDIVDQIIISSTTNMTVVISSSGKFRLVCMKLHIWMQG